MMRFSNWLIGLSLAAVFAGLWFVMNRPVAEEPWEEDIESLSYVPYRADQNPFTGKAPSLADIRADLALIAGEAQGIRTYEAAGINRAVAAIAAENGLNVTAGAWIEEGEDAASRRRDRAEIDSLVETARRVPSVNRLIVGNESVFRSDQAGIEGEDRAARERRIARHLERLSAAIDEVRVRTGLPVSTAETYYIWKKYPELIDRVDFVAVHILPYWNGVPVEKAVEQALAEYRDLERLVHRAYPDKRLLIAEIGWPSEGLTRLSPQGAFGAAGAAASPVNQGLFLRKFLIEAKKSDLDYNIVEAFDQPWKMRVEGGVGAYWGLWRADRSPKPALAGHLIDLANWRWFAAAAIGLGLLFVLFALRAELALNRYGRLFVALLGYGGIMAVALIYARMSQLYLTAVDLIALIAIAPAMILLLAIFLAEGVEMAANLWLGRSQRRLVPPPEAGGWPLPKVSIHVPCYNEPPAMMIETIRALERLDYPDFEVLVIDNNTKEEAVWKPVEAYVATLKRPNFRFFHLPRWPGFKAGALNFALLQTHPDAAIIATIDSDYLVAPDWLKRLAPHFADPAVALVQAPQDYRDGGEDLFKRMCFWEYAGFFHLGMKARDEKNAIIQHGTMALIRKSALQEAGGWAEWCITEDAELGLRLFAGGNRAIYTESSFGQGLMPDSFDAYRKQRYRWAYGAMQILKRHWRALLPFGRSGLSPAQRYQFLAGWLPWIADALQLSFIALAIAWSLGMMLWPQWVEPPLTLYLFVTLGMFLFKVGKSFWLYARKVPCGLADNIGAAIAGLALSHAVGKAVWRGLFTANLPFHRTPKLEHAPAALRGLVAAREEAAILAILLACGIAIARDRGAIEPAALLWSILLFVQALPYFAALLLSMINALQLGKAPPASILTEEPASA